jgi:hypothetical protein
MRSVELQELSIDLHTTDCCPFHRSREAKKAVVVGKYQNFRIKRFQRNWNCHEKPHSTLFQRMWQLAPHTTLYSNPFGAWAPRVNYPTSVAVQPSEAAHLSQSWCVWAWSTVLAFTSPHLELFVTKVIGIYVRLIRARIQVVTNTLYNSAILLVISSCSHL